MSPHPPAARRAGGASDLARLIKQARQSLGDDQRTVAELAGISAQYMSDIEAGRRIPPPDTLIDIALACCIDRRILLWEWVRLQLGADDATELRDWLEDGP